MDNGRNADNLYQPNDFYLQMKEVLQDASPGEYAFVSLDIDHFNTINDMFGYETGTAVLSKLENLFSQSLGDREFFSHLHGDYFVFLVQTSLESSFTGRFLEIVDFKDALDCLLPHNYHCVCSGGIFVVHDLTENVISILDKANFAKKKAKNHKGNSFVCFDKALERDLTWQNSVMFSIQEAFANEEFEMYLQPKVMIKTGQIIGAEALARWNSKEHGFIYPDRFIPILEQNGYIGQLDYYILNQACKFIRESIDMDIPILPISVNFSKAHIDNKSFVETVYHTVSQYGIPTRLIEIEVTESMISNNFQLLIETARELKNLGFRISLDDFGKAYSSLNCLKDMPFDIIKIDKEFLNSTANTERGRIIISKMVDMIKSIHMVPVMEGIETPEQAAFLETSSCDLGQGFFYSKPLPKLAYRSYILNSDTLTDTEAVTPGFPVSDDHSCIYDGEKTLKQTDCLQRSLENKIKELNALIASEQESREALRLSEERYRLVVEQSDDVMFEWNFETDSIIFSEKHNSIFHWTVMQDNVTTNPQIRQIIHPDDLADFETWINNTYKKSGFHKAEFRLLEDSGKYTWIRNSTTAICDRNGVPIKAVGLFSDINQQKTEMKTLIRKAQLDPLTKLYNKEELQLQIENILLSAPDQMAAFLIIDIDNFKGVNDNLGHQFGDTVLKEVASKVRDTFRESDILGRLGGDELVIFMRNVDSIESIRLKAAQLVKLLNITYYGETKKYTISISAGISNYPSHGKTFAELYRMADTALYESKRKGKNCYTIYCDKMNTPTAENRTPFDTSGRFLNEYFSGDISFNIFEMLYETKDIKTTVNKILQQLGEQFGVDRVYIFENDDDGISISNTYEWCAGGVEPEMPSLQGLPFDLLGSFFSSYNSEGILYCNDISNLEPVSQNMLRSQGVKSLLHCAICKNGEHIGFVGFDDCGQKRDWRRDEIAMLGYVSRILSVFMIQNRTMRELKRSNDNLLEMLENLNGFVYVIDADTHDLLYINGAVRKLGSRVGEKCHQMAFNSDIPCEDCPVRKLTDITPFTSEEIYSERIDRWVSAAASKIHWRGRKNTALVCCTDISEYKK